MSTTTIRKASKASTTTTSKAQPAVATYNPKVGEALAAESLSSTADRIASAKAAAAWRAYVLNKCTHPAVSTRDIAATLDIGKSEADYYVKAGAMLDRLGPAYCLKVVKIVIAVAHEPRETVTHLDGLKGRALYDGIVKASNARKARTNAAAAARAAGGAAGKGTPKGKADGSESKAPATNLARLEAAGSVLAAVRFSAKVSDTERAAVATIVAHVTRIVAEIGGPDLVAAIEAKVSAPEPVAPVRPATAHRGRKVKSDAAA